LRAALQFVFRRLDAGIDEELSLASRQNHDIPPDPIRTLMLPRKGTVTMSPLARSRYRAPAPVWK
jgi:hypothetical protein